MQIDQHDSAWQDYLPELAGREYPELGPVSLVRRVSETSEAADDQSGASFLDQLTVGEVRRMLEGCALHNLSRAVPELVQHVAHSSHTPATITKAWREFEEATRDMYALHLRGDESSAAVNATDPKPRPDQELVSLVRSYADYAWQLILRGPVGDAARASA